MFKDPYCGVPILKTEDRHHVIKGLEIPLVSRDHSERFCFVLLYMDLGDILPTFKTLLLTYKKFILFTPYSKFCPIYQSLKRDIMV